MTYVAIINAPSYLSERDELQVFDTPADAWAWLESECEQLERDATFTFLVPSECLRELRRLAELAPGTPASASVYTPNWDGTGAVYGPFYSVEVYDREGGRS